MVKITISGGGELKGSEADIVKGFVIKDNNCLRVFYKLMNRKSGIVWLNNSIGDLW